MMRCLAAAYLVLAAVVCGCEPDRNNCWVAAPSSASPENDGCWTDHGYSVMAKVVMIKGHEYIFVSQGRDCKIVHAASCPMCAGVAVEVVEIRGHEYIVIDQGENCGIVHAASCKCLEK